MNNYKENLVIVLVGLPARGVTTIGKKIIRYFSWLGYATAMYIKDEIDIVSLLESSKHEKCPKTNIDECDHELIEKAAHFLNGGGNIVIIDSSNYTSLQRSKTRTQLENLITGSFKILFLEMINNNIESVNENIYFHCTHDQNFKSLPLVDAIDLYRKRITELELIYECLDEMLDGDDCCYIRIYRHSTKLEALNVKNGFLFSKLMAFIMNIKLDHHKIMYFVRQHEEYSEKKGHLNQFYEPSIGEKLNTSALNEFFLKERKCNPEKRFSLYTSALSSSSELLNELLDKLSKRVSLKCLDSIEKGKKYSISEDQEDKLNVLYEREESYMDLINRLDIFVYDMERSSNSMIILCDESVIRCLYGYLKSIPIEKIPNINIPDNKVIKIDEYINSSIEETQIPLIPVPQYS